MNREKAIVRTSILGILANVFLSGFKAAVGLLAHSVSMILDAVNNLTDALSSVVTIVGTKLAGRSPDRKHPLGHGRIEHLSAMIIGVIILYAGVTSLVESIKKIIAPETPEHTVYSYIVLGVAILVKIFLGLFFKKTGKDVKSETLKASGTDALFDAVISTSVLVGAVIFILSGLNIEAWLGAVISLFILKSGFEVLKDATGEILGRRVDSEITKKVRASMSEFPEVQGVFDLILHDYGPEKYMGSAHIAVAESMTVEDLDALERKIAGKVYEDTGVIMAGISVYAVNETKDLPKAVESEIRALMSAHPEVMEIHGFRLFEEEKMIQFDMVIDFSVKNREKRLEELGAEIQEHYPEYKIYITLDADISD